MAQESGLIRNAPEWAAQIIYERRNRALFRLAAISLVCAFIFTEGVLLLFIDLPRGADLFFLIFFWMTLFSLWPLYKKISRGTFDLIEFPVWVTVEQWLRMGGFAIFYFLYPDTLWEVFRGDFKWLNYAAFVWTISVPCLWFGYNSQISLRLSRLRPLRGYFPSSEYAGIRLWVVLGGYFLLTLLRLHLLWEGGYGHLINSNSDVELVESQLGGLKHLLSYGDLISLFTLSLLLVQNQGIGGKFIWNNAWFAIVLVNEFIFRIAWGSKGLIAYMFLVLIVVTYKRWGRLGKFFPIGVLVLAIMVPVNMEHDRPERDPFEGSARGHRDHFRCCREEDGEFGKILCDHG